MLPLPNPSRLTNLSVLTRLLPGEPLYAGFAINGTGNTRVLVRVVGPTLSAFNIGNRVLNTGLALYNQSTGVLIGSNDDWLATDTSAIAASGAFPLPAGSFDAALVATLTPGNYSVQALGPVNVTGTVLIEVYEAP